jgi:hypothetical protein
MPRQKYDERTKSLVLRIRANHVALRSLLHEVQDEWTYEDLMYRFYHQSFKVFYLQASTERIAKALRALQPEQPLCLFFETIYREGTGKTFAPEDNQRWLEATRPIIEAFLHAKYMLEMAVKYGETLGTAPTLLPSGWAALLTLYDLR